MLMNIHAPFLDGKLLNMFLSNHLICLIKNIAGLVHCQAGKSIQLHLPVILVVFLLLNLIDMRILLSGDIGPHDRKFVHPFILFPFCLRNILSDRVCSLLINLWWKFRHWLFIRKKGQSNQENDFL